MEEVSEIKELSLRDFMAQGVQAVVYRVRARVTVKGGHSADNGDDDENFLTARWIAVKTVSFLSHKPPHDIRKEANILSQLSHANIISLFCHTVSRPLEQYELFMPLVPLNLPTLLDSPLFSPNSHQALSHLIPSNPPISFDIVSKSLIFQLILGIAHLHNLRIPIAHRDIKPGNVMISASGCVKIIDFGVAWVSSPTQDSSEGPSEVLVEADKETEENMYYQVGSGAYRAPELFFSPIQYDAKATDLWSLGATLASFFTSLRFFSREEDELDWKMADEEGKLNATSPFIYPETDEVDGTWRRVSLFDSSRGDLGLVVSIFRVRGTPDEVNWPSFKQLPGALRLNFVAFPRLDLGPLLPNLPSSSSPSSPLDLIDRLLLYEPSTRLSASAALSHPWFRESDLVLPIDHVGPWYGESSVEVKDLKWERRDLGLDSWMKKNDQDEEMMNNINRFHYDSDEDELVDELAKGVQNVSISS